MFNHLSLKLNEKLSKQYGLDCTFRLNKETRMYQEIERSMKLSKKRKTK
jgi:hypothetical protein